MRVMMTLAGWGWLMKLAALWGAAAVFGQVLTPDPSAAAGGAADPEATDPVAGDPAPEEPEPAADAVGTAEDGDPDDDDPEDAGLAPDVRDNPARLRTRLRRTQRALAELRPLADRLRGPNGERMDLDHLLYAARQFQELQAAMQRNPALRTALYGEQPDADREPERAAFDEAALPFDTSTPEGQFFARQARQLHEMQTLAQRLERRLEQGDRRSSEESAARHETEWKGAALAAAQQIPSAYRTMFVEAVYGRFFRAQAGNQLGTTKVRQVIDGLLRGLSLSKDQRERASHAAGARIAESNRRLPAAPRGGAPAGPQREEPKKPTTRTVADVNRAFLEKHAG